MRNNHLMNYVKCTSTCQENKSYSKTEVGECTLMVRLERG